MVARGHRVTVMARWRVGLAEDEQHPAGYGSGASGLRHGWLPGDSLRRCSAGGTGGRAAGAPGRRPATRPAPTAPPAERRPTWSAPGGLGGRCPRAAPDGVVRLASIVLVRSQIRNTSVVPEPACGLYHGMAYMGIPVALDLGKRNGAPVVYDARDIYVDAATSPDCRGRPANRRALGAQLGAPCERVMTVNRPYAEVMAGRWKVEMPLIVLNCAYRRAGRRHGRGGSTRCSASRPRPGSSCPGRLLPRPRHGAVDRGIPSVPDAVLVLLGYGNLQAQLERRVAEPAGFAVRAGPARGPAKSCSTGSRPRMSSPCRSSRPRSTTG